LPRSIRFRLCRLCNELEEPRQGTDHNSDAAQRLKDDIEAKAAKLPEFPKLCRAGRLEGTREMVVWASFIVAYQVDAVAVRALRVLHGAQQWRPEEE
jgi:toxin ParE1/3/4